MMFAECRSVDLVELFLTTLGSDPRKKWIDAEDSLEVW